MDFGNLSSILGDPNAINTMLGGDAITPSFGQQTGQPPDPNQFGAQLANAPNPDGPPAPGADQPWQKQTPMPMPPMPGGDGGGGQPPDGGVPSMAPPMPPPQNIPMPPPRPPDAPQGPMQGPPMPPPMPQGGPPMNPQLTATPNGPPAGPPMPGGPGLPGGYPQGGPTPNFNTPIEPLRRPEQPQGGLMGALGINLSPERRAGLAAGLKSVGTNWNKPGLAAAAGSAGSALEGEQKKGEQEDQDQMKRNQQQFAQTSTAFGDLMKAQATGNATKIADAHSAYFQARAQQAIASGGGAGDFRNSPYGKSVTIEGQVFKETDAARKTMEKKWTLNAQNGTLTSEQQAAQRAADEQTLKAGAQTRRAELYKQAGIDPAQGQKLANTGLEPPQIKGADGKLVPNPNFNPFDARQMSKQQFEATVPVGAHFRDVDGKIYKRTLDKPKAGDKVSEVEKTNDDYMASQPIAES